MMIKLMQKMLKKLKPKSLADQSDMFVNPPQDCHLCPRLLEFRQLQQARFPDWYNAPVHGFGAIDAKVAIVGLAPGLRGANRTGRPFTGDFAGNLLYQMMQKHGWTSGQFDPDGDDDLVLHGARIINAVRCLPPQNKPLPIEIKTCRQFLEKDLLNMPAVKVFMTLGQIAHNSLLDMLSLKRSDYKFCHGGEWQLNDGRTIISSYHCSRYNTQTRRLTEPMFNDIFTRINAIINHL